MLNDAITDLVCQVYQRALGVERVGPDDDFFRDLGGDSLMLAEVVSSIFELLHVDIMETMTTTSTPASLAGFIATRLPADGASRPPPSSTTASPALIEAAQRIHAAASQDRGAAGAA